MAFQKNKGKSHFKWSMKWCHTHPESFCISCHPYNLIESCHHSVKDWTRSAKTTFSRDSHMLVLLTPRNELQLKTTWRRQAGWGLLNGQWWKRPNVPVRTHGDWNYFIQDVLFINHDSHFYSFILNVGGVGMGEEISAWELQEKQINLWDQN